VYAGADQLVQAGRVGFTDKSPAARKLALEKLWDAWERLKSLHDVGNKRLSVAHLLDQAAAEPAFRALLENEAHALTEIGNSFQIRHFETNRAPIAEDAHVDYLFHRMWALLWLLLTSRSPQP
jgi:phage major head subunit gpT-like protein